jgi:hypothetical protein
MIGRRFGLLLLEDEGFATVLQHAIPRHTVIAGTDISCRTSRAWGGRRVQCRAVPAANALRNAEEHRRHCQRPPEKASSITALRKCRLRKLALLGVLPMRYIGFPARYVFPVSALNGSDALPRPMRRRRIWCTSSGLDGGIPTRPVSSVKLILAVGGDHSVPVLRTERFHQSLLRRLHTTRERAWLWLRDAGSRCGMALIPIS